MRWSNSPAFTALRKAWTLARVVVRTRSGVSAAERPGIVDNARVCVSDVATNVLRHTDVPVLAVEVSVLRDRVVVGVRDSDPGGRPRVGKPSEQAESGRGLLLVQSLAHAWGVSWTGGLAPTGKRVWVELREACGAQCAHVAARETGW